MTALSILALAVRLSGLTAESFWIDEVVTAVFVAERSAFDVVRDSFRIDFHPFAYYLALDLWTSLFGTSDGAARLLSVVIGAGTVPLAHRVGFLASGSRRVALAVGLATALWPLPIWYGQECRMYALLIGAYTGCLLALDRALRKGLAAGPVSVLLAAFALFAYAHGAAGILGLPFFALALWLCPAGGGAPAIGARRRIVAIAALVAIYVPWLLRMVAIRSDPKIYGTLTPGALGDLGQWLLFLNYRAPGWLVPVVVGAGLVAMIGIAGAWLAGERRREIALVLGALVVPLVTAMVVTQLRPVHAHRNLAFLFVPLVVVLARGIEAVPRTVAGAGSLARGLLLGATLIGAAGTAGFALAATYWDLTRAPQKEDWRAVTSELSSRLGPNDVLAFDAPFTRAGFDRYRGQRAPRVAAPDVESILGTLGTLGTPGAPGAPGARLYVVTSHAREPDALDGALGSAGFERVFHHEARGIEVRGYAPPPK